MRLKSLVRLPVTPLYVLDPLFAFQTFVLWMYRGFRHGSFDPPVTVWRVSSLQPKMVERKSRQGSILLYLIG